MDNGFWAFIKEHKFTVILLAIGFILGVSRTGQMLTGRQRNLMGEINRIARGES